MKPFIVLLLLSTLFPFAAKAQQELDDQQVQDVIEKIIENTEGSADYTDLVDQLGYYRKNKLDLNHCTADDLSKLGILTATQAFNIMAHRLNFGDYLSFYELQTVPGIDVETIKMMMPFVKIDKKWRDDQSSIKQMFKKGHLDVVALGQRTLQINEGTRRRREGDTLNGKDYYAGSPYRSVVRMRYAYSNKLSIGFTGEKDAGESFGRGVNPYGFDFNSFHVYLANYKNIKRLVIGDFNLLLGQGLTFGSGLGFGKSAMVLNVKRNYYGIRPYRSVNENEFLRGFGITYGLTKNMDVTVFASRRKIDGNLVGDTVATSEDFSFTSILSSGYHRTQAEILSKHTVQQTIAGGNIGIKIKALQLGFSGVTMHFSPELNINEKPYSQFRFQGSSDTKVGMNYSWNYRNVNWFGETSKDLAGGWASISSLLIALAPKLDMIMSYRNYQRNFHPIITNAFGESSGNENEKGFYTGLVARPMKGVTFNAYLDVYKFPWMRYLTDQPGTVGIDYLTELNYSPNKQFTFYVRHRHETKPRNAFNNLSTLDYVASTNRRQLRFHAQYKLSPQVTLKARFEWIRFNSENMAPENGYLIFQDIQWKSPTYPVSIMGRMAYFSTDGYYSRIYVYENDMLYSFSVPALINKGTRAYVLFKWRAARKLDIWMRYAITRYDGQTTVGSGLDQTQGPVRSDFKLQFRWSIDAD